MPEIISKLYSPSELSQRLERRKQQSPLPRLEADAKRRNDISADGLLLFPSNSRVDTAIGADLYYGAVISAQGYLDEFHAAVLRDRDRLQPRLLAGARQEHAAAAYAKIGKLADRLAKAAKPAIEKDTASLYGVALREADGGDGMPTDDVRTLGRYLRQRESRDILRELGPDAAANILFAAAHDPSNADNRSLVRSVPDGGILATETVIPKDELAYLCEYARAWAMPGVELDREAARLAISEFSGVLRRCREVLGLPEAF